MRSPIRLRLPRWETESRRPADVRDLSAEAILRRAFSRGPGRRGLMRGLGALLPWLVLVGSLAAAESPSRPVRAAPLRYRKVFLPREAIRNLESGVLQDEAFVPLRREEFDQLLGAVGAKLSAPQEAASPQVVQATYTARLDGEQLLGAARLTVVQRADPTAVLPLEPCNLVISEPRWQPDKKAAAAPDAAPPPAAESSSPAADGRPAAPPSAAGVTDESGQAVELGCDDAGRIVALVNTSGVLHFNWSRRGAKSTAGELGFDLRLPNAIVNHLRLTLPAALQPAADAAIVSPLPESPGAGAERSWLIELRGGADLAVRLKPASGALVAEPLILLRQDHRYACGLDAVEVAVRLRLDVHQTPLSELTLALDEPLQLYRAYYRDSPLDWSEAKPGTQRQVTLALPEPLLGDGHEIRLQAIAPADVGAAWRLPRVAVPGVFWLEGVSRLEAPEPLWVSHLETVGCRQLQTAPLLAPLRGQSLEIRDFQPQPKIVAMLQRRGGEAVAQTVTRVKLGTAAANLECDAELTCSGPPQYDVTWDVLPGWTVDLVETQPPDALEDWQLAFRSPQNRSLEIRFRRPLPADQPVRLTVHAHRRGLRLGERLRGRELRLGALRDVKVARSVIAVTADAAHRIALSGDAGLRRLAAGDLSSWEQDRLQSAAGAVTFLDGETAEEVSLALLGETPSYSAEVHVDSTYSEKWVEQVFRLRCQPIASTVDRLVVHFSEPLTTAPRWTFSGEEGSVLARALGGGDETAGQSPAGSQSWEIVLPRPRGDAFELLATRSDAFSGTAAVPLVSLPAAASQVGYVTLRSAALPLSIEPRNVRPIPAEPPPPGRYSTTRGAFRYDPSLDCRLSVRIADKLPGSAWVRSYELRTSVLGDGRALHTAVCQVENRGQSQVLIVPPAAAELLDLLVSGRPVFRPRQAATQAGVTVNLPAGERFPTLAVCYTTPCSRSGPWATVVAPWPNLGMPIFERHWILQLPPGWRVESTGATAQADWQTRLFGLVLRTPPQARFDPLSARLGRAGRPHGAARRSGRGLGRSARRANHFACRCRRCRHPKPRLDGDAGPRLDQLEPGAVRFSRDPCPHCPTRLFSRCRMGGITRDGGVDGVGRPPPAGVLPALDGALGMRGAVLPGGVGPPRQRLLSGQPGVGARRLAASVRSAAPRIGIIRIVEFVSRRPRVDHDGGGNAADGAAGCRRQRTRAAGPGSTCSTSVTSVSASSASVCPGRARSTRADSTRVCSSTVCSSTACPNGACSTSDCPAPLRGSSGQDLSRLVSCR